MRAKIHFNLFLRTLPFFISMLLVAQDNLLENFEFPPDGCGTDAIHENKMINNIAYRKAIEKQENLIYEKSKEQLANPALKNSGVIYTIPVVFHIIHEDGTPIGYEENLTDDDVRDELFYVLNYAFRHQSGVNYTDNPDIITNPYNGIDTEIEFCLATTDPDGNYTTGIIRHSNDSLAVNVQNQGRFTDLLWNTQKYYNIFLVKDIPGAAGYKASDVSLPDGTVDYTRKYTVNATDWSSIGSIAGTIVHETGHWLSLNHPWNGGCTNNDCLLDGDKICDTPPDGTSAYTSCFSSYNSCMTDEDDTSTNNPFRSVSLGGLGEWEDTRENYMGYGCYRGFTIGQKDRMRLNIQNILAPLLNSNKCNFIPYQYDISIESVQSPAYPNDFCSTFIPSVTVKNRSTHTSPITSAEIELFINGVFESKILWEGTLDIDQETQVLFPPVTIIGTGINEFLFKVNIADDAYLPNNEYKLFLTKDNNCTIDIECGGIGNNYVVDSTIIDALSLDIGDMDNDGLEDIITVSFDQNQVIWYKNLGNNEFQPFIIDNTFEGAYFVQVADMNSDGWLDIVGSAIAQPGENAGDLDRISWWQNLGNGTFSNEIILETVNDLSILVDVASLTLDDLDDDGDIDIIIGIFYFGQTRWLENLGNGTFSNSNYIGAVFGLEYVNVVDWNGDGDKDILASSSIIAAGRGVYYWENMGNASFNSQEDTLTEPFNNISFLKVTDIDADNDPDIIIGEQNLDIIVILKNDGMGNIIQMDTIITNINYPTGFDCADINNDGFVDITALSWYDNTVEWWSGTSNGTFNQEGILVDDFIAPRYILNEDLDNDGQVEIIASSQQSGITIFAPSLQDSDNDGIVDYCDYCPYSSTNDFDGDGYCGDIDCDDTNPLEFPNQIWYQDIDGNGIGNPNNTIISCNEIAGYVSYTCLDMNLTITSSFNNMTDIFCESSTTTLIASNIPNYYLNAYQYQWYKNGVPISGQNNQTLLVNDYGNYTVSVINLNDNYCNPITSNIFSISNRLNQTPFCENFNTDLSTNWLESVNDPNILFTQENIVSCFDNNNYILKFNSYTNFTDKDTIYTFYGYFDLSSLYIPYLSFNYAYNRFNDNYIPGYNILDVAISNDCGISYTNIYNKSAFTSSNYDSSITGAWQPSSCEDWKNETVDISAYSGQKVLIKFSVSKYSSYNAWGQNLYFDNIKIYDNAVFAPYCQDFENGGNIPNGWERQSQTSKQWLFADTTGIQPQYGPNNDHTSGTGYFAWVDDSSSGENDSVYLVSPYISLSTISNPYVSFWLYSMSSSNDYAILNIDLWDGTSWNNDIYTWTGDSGGWMEVTIPLTNYNITAPIRIRFENDNDNDSFRNDIAIDDFCIQGDMVVCPPTLYIPNTITGGLYEASNNVYSDGNVAPNSTTTFHAENYVELQPNFDIPLNTQFTIDIQPCGTPPVAKPTDSNTEDKEEKK